MADAESTESGDGHPRGLQHDGLGSQLTVRGHRDHVRVRCSAPVMGLEHPEQEFDLSSTRAE